MVALLICAQNLKFVVDAVYVITYDIWILALALLLWPLIMLGTPSEFWPAAAAALLTSVVAVFLILSDAITVLSNHGEPAQVDEVSFRSVFMTFGAMFFAYGGTMAFPSYQNDMKDRNKFGKAVFIGFVGKFFVLIVNISS